MPIALAARVQIWVQVWAPSGHLRINQGHSWRLIKLLFQKTIKSFECKINGRAHGAVLSFDQSVWQAQTQDIYACYTKMCSLVQHWPSWRVNKFWMLGWFWAVTAVHFFHWHSKRKIVIKCYTPKKHSLLEQISLSRVPWVKVRHTFESSCSESMSPVQSSRFELTSCPRTGMSV